MILSLIVAFVSGVLTNYTNRMVGKVSQAGWRSISLYLIRTTLKIPAVLMIQKQLQDDIEDKQTLTLVSYILASASYGMGVIVGWLLDEL